MDGVRTLAPERRNGLMLVGAAAISGLAAAALSEGGGWQAGAAMCAGPAAVGAVAFLGPVAWRKSATLVARLRLPQALFILLLTSVYFDTFFEGATTRTAADLAAQPATAITLTREILVALAGVGAVCMIAANYRKVADAVRGPMLFMAAYAAIAVISVTRASNPLISAGKSFEVAVDVLVAAVLAAFATNDELRRLWKFWVLIVGVMMAGAWVSALAMPATGFEHQPGALLPILWGACPSIHPNSGGQYSAMLILVSFIKLARRESPHSERWLWRSTMALGVVSLIFAQARTAMIACSLVFVLACYLSRKTYLLLLLAAAGGLALLGGVGNTAMSFLQRGQSDEVFHSLSGRGGYWLEAWLQFKESPIFGAGYYTAHRIDLTARYRVLDISTVDNTYLEALLDVGILGALPLFLGVMWLAARLWKRARRSRIGGFDHEVMICFAIVLVRSFTGPTFQAHSPSLLAVLLLMAYVLRDPSRPELERVK